MYVLAFFLFLLSRSVFLDVSGFFVLCFGEQALFIEYYFSISEDKMQNPNLNITQTLWFSACGAALLWFMYWIFYDLIVWSKLLVEVSPLNYFGVALSVSLMLFSGLGVRKLESLCYLGSTASILWFAYWITYDLTVWNKSFSEVNTVNYIGVVLSLWLVFVPKIATLKPKKQAVVQATAATTQKRTAPRTKKRVVVK